VAVAVDRKQSGNYKMANSIKVSAKLKGTIAEVKSLMLHPMETGARIDKETGQNVPAHHITQLVFTNNGKQVMVANFSTAVSKNPFFSFKFDHAKAGDTLVATWVDNNGGTDQLETKLV
jgi:sulfur-oxidizing protein SoxZ